MYATIRRYEDVDDSRSGEIVREVGATLLPLLEELPGFAAYHLLDAGGSVLTSISLFETAAQAHESTRVAARWVRERNLEGALPTSPKITAGPVVATQTGAPAALTARF